MRRIVCSLIAFSLLPVFSLNVPAKASKSRSGSAGFVLPQGRVGEVYQQNLLLILQDKYNTSIAGGSTRLSLKWMGIGRLPAGLILETTGEISGIPESAQELPYIFRVQVTDTKTPDAEPLELVFSLKVLPARMRLVNNNSLRLVSARDAGKRASSSRRERTELAFNGAPDFSFAPTRQAVGVDDTDASDMEAAGEGGNINSACQGIDIISISRPKKDDLSIEVVVKNTSVTAVDIFVRSAESTSNPKRMSITQADDSSPVTIGEEIKLKKGKNTISVIGLDANNKTVACGEKLINFTGTPSPPPATPIAVIPPTTFLPPGPISLTLTPQIAKKSAFSLKALLYGEKANNVKEVYVRIVDGGGNVVDEGPKSIENLSTPTSGRQTGDIPVKLGYGHNIITVLAVDGSSKKTALGEDTITVTCEEKECSSVVDTNAQGLHIEPPFTVSNQPETPVRVTVVQPKLDGSLTGEAKTKAQREIEQQKIKEIYYQVTDTNGEIFDHGAVTVDDNAKIQPVLVELREGPNTVMFFGRNGAGQKNTLETLTRVECRNCTGPSSKLTGNSIYTRAIVGFEQVGGSATDSTQKPFLDFFFGAPIGRQSGGQPHRVQLWGNARIASFPLESDPTALSAFTSGFLNTTSGLKINKIAQGFDFLAGMDIRLIPLNDKPYFSLIPGTRQRSSVSFIASFGAITPLSASNNQVQLLAAIPKNAAGDIDPAFLKLFPEAAGKKNIAFVTPARDRFYRQYYAGVRVKTLFYDRHDRLINQFPAIFDFTFGQNELVTGSLRNVIRFEGFYPFPIKEASFFYLYGTVTMKVGRGGGKVDLPLFLKNADATASPADLDTLVVSFDKNPVLRSNRDNYRLGIGINLIELLNKLRTPSPAN